MSSASNLERLRQVIPRWVTFRGAERLGELLPLSALSSASRDAVRLDRKRADFVKLRTLPYAVDFVGAALEVGTLHEELGDDLKAALGVLRAHGQRTGLVGELASVVDGQSESADVAIPSHTAAIHGLIGRSKAAVRFYPRDSIRWTELALLYSVLGQNESAKRCINIALSISSTSRYVVRSAARFFLHIEDPERAHAALKRSGLSLLDPWVLAAELSIADHFVLTSNKFKIAAEFLKDQKFAPAHMSELGAVIATVEGRNGANRKARKLLEVALMKPTENVAAQAVWLAPRISMTTLPDFRASLGSDEAKFRVLRQQSNFQGAVDAAKSWLRFQPFSSHPAIEGSYVAGVALGDHQAAIELTNFALRASPREPLLLNNLAFSSASLGDTERANAALSLIPADSGVDKDTLQATRGIVKFREGNLDLGRTLYTDAIKSFEARRQHRSQALATYFLGLEEVRIGQQSGHALIAEALQLAKKYSVVELEVANEKRNTKSMQPNPKG